MYLYVSVYYWFCFSDGSWTERSTIPVGTGSTPVSSMLLSGGKLWCATHSSIKIINPHTLQVSLQMFMNIDDVCVMGGAS